MADLAKILVVDDDPVYLAILKAQLEFEGYRVFCTGDSGMVETLMKSQRPDLLMLDDKMDDCTGTELLAELRKTEHGRNIPAFIMSASDPGDSCNKALASGAEAYIDKFLDPKELLAQIRKSLVVGEPGDDQGSPLEVSDLFLARYRLDVRLGESGSGETFKAFDSLENVWVALQFFRARTFQDAGALHKHFSEAQRGRELTKAMPEMYGYASEPRPHIVREYIEAKSLERLLEERGGLSVREVSKIGFQLGEALGALHSHGLVHRNMKPPNLLLGAQSSVSILDFGLGGGSGYNPYLAPECYNSNYGVVDHRADLYAAGVLLYEAFTGGKPFEASDGGKSVELMLHKSAKRPSECRGDGETVLDPILLKCLSRYPDGRYNSGEQMAQAFRDILI